jgi:hypothetical protein
MGARLQVSAKHPFHLTCHLAKGDTPYGLPQTERKPKAQGKHLSLFARFFIFDEKDH